MLIHQPGLTEDGYFPKGAASVCLAGSPRQCYTPPADFGRNAAAEVVELEKGLPALLFSAASGGVSGFRIHFALLRPGTGSKLEDWFMDEMEFSNQSQYAFWTDLSISPAKLFVIADWVAGPGESHYGDHRYIISVYLRRSSPILDERYYFLSDRYMTARKYDLEAKADVLGSEKAEILARLKRVKQLNPW